VCYELLHTSGHAEHESVPGRCDVDINESVPLMNLRWILHTLSIPRRRDFWECVNVNVSSVCSSALHVSVWDFRTCFTAMACMKLKLVPGETRDCSFRSSETLTWLVCVQDSDYKVAFGGALFSDPPWLTLTLFGACSGI